MMMDELDALLKASGYIYMTREVRESNDYANKVKARYGDRVEFEKFIPGFDHVGHQRYMRIRV